MITQWDIISSISPRNNAILYALLIDGTEHDARLIAKKLQGYVQAPQPALAPYVYRFGLAADLDEDTLEKIRVAVREGIEQAKKVNEFMPGGALGNPLFNADVDKNDKDFPTFITLDPSESFFREARHTLPPQEIQEPDVDEFEQKHIDLNAPEEEVPQIAKTLEEIDNAGYRSDPPGEPTPLAEPEPPLAKPQEMETDLSVTADELPPHVKNGPETQTWPEEAQTGEGLTSVEADEAWSDEPPAGHTGIDLEVKAVQPQDLPPELTPETSAPHQAAKDPDLPLTDKDMLNKDMEGTLLDQSLEDIFSAETKYDMFLDLDKLTPQPAAKPPQTPAERQTEPEAAARELSPDAVPAAPGAACEPAIDEKQQDADGFNIFDQKIKDQTCFVDLDDVQNITERITQKDLSFLQHARVKPEAPADGDKPQTPPVQKTPNQAPAPALFNRFEKEEDAQEVMDPFEQLLAASAQKEPSAPEVQTAAQEPQTQPQEPRHETSGAQAAREAAPEAPAAVDRASQTTEEARETASFAQQAADAAEEIEETEEQAPAQPHAPSGEMERKNRVVPPPAVPITEKKMPENKGDKKPILRIKRKDQPQESATPAAPKPPQAPAPAQPAVPAQSAPAQPSAPVQPAAPQPAMPAPPPSAQMPGLPQDEKQRTILRKRRPANTFLEKTRTIDHSIELPLSELKKHNWPLEVPLIPTFTLENMTISVNRFAHATAISVIDNPGKLYNPLVMHGSSGTGKTHFLHAIGYALSKKYGQENIFITNGVRLSRGIQRYVMEGNMDKFEKFVTSVKALLIDDIHLIAINEQNRAHLSKLLNEFLAQQKQIVITSKYPPESLEKLEELLDFKLDSGWISDLKPAAGPARTRIIQKMLTSNGINITDEEINRFFGHPNMSLGTVARSIRRVRVLEKMIFPQGIENQPQGQHSEAAIFDKLLATKGEDQNSLIMQKSVEEVNSAPVSGKGEWGRIGFFYPQNHSNMMNWLVFALQQRAKELGISGGPELAVRSSYSTENIISSAFKIANLCDNKKLKGAVILGPETDACEPSVRENFYDILTHMLEIMLIRCGVINYEDVKAPSTYVKILSELLR